MEWLIEMMAETGFRMNRRRRIKQESVRNPNQYWWSERKKRRRRNWIRRSRISGRWKWWMNLHSDCHVRQMIKQWVGRIINHCNAVRKCGGANQNPWHLFPYSTKQIVFFLRFLSSWLLLFHSHLVWCCPYQVANCAPSRPREDAGRVPGNPASSYLPSVISSGSSSSRSRTTNTKSQQNRKGAAPPSFQGHISDTGIVVKDPPNEIGFRRVYRWSTGCSIQSGANLLRFLPGGGVDARGDSSDPDSEFAFFYFHRLSLFHLVILFVCLLAYFLSNWLKTVENNATEK